MTGKVVIDFEMKVERNTKMPILLILEWMDHQNSADYKESDPKMNETGQNNSGQLQLQTKEK